MSTCLTTFDVQGCDAMHMLHTDPLTGNGVPTTEVWGNEIPLFTLPSHADRPLIEAVLEVRAVASQLGYDAGKAALANQLRALLGAARQEEGSQP